MLRHWLRNFKENADSEKYLVWFLIGIMGLIAIYTFSSSYFYQQQLKETTLVMEKQVGEFKILHYQGPSPFKVDMIDMATEENLKDIMISVDCPKYQKNAIGLIVPMYKVLNLKTSTGEKFFTYEGAYDQLCTNKQIDNK